ncbi:MAG: molybdenum cofactor biosynthesis protein MoaE [Candidatus Helarchaeota archaeon]
MIGVYEKGTINLEDLIKEAKTHSDIDRAGAIVTFTGIVRRIIADNKYVKNLKIDVYKEMAENILKKIVSEEIHNGILDIQIVHLVGTFEKGEDLVYVVVLGKHREECFRTIQRVVNRYKSEAPFWKKEILESGEEYWIDNPLEDQIE